LSDKAGAGVQLNNYQSADADCTVNSLPVKKASRLDKAKTELKKILRLPRYHNIKGAFYKNTILLKRNVGFVAAFGDFLLPRR
jgi:hypothetical protein